MGIETEYGISVPGHPTMNAMVASSQIVFGTDYPYRTSEEHVKGLAGIFGAADLKLIERDNALRILPRLRA